MPYKWKHYSSVSCFLWRVWVGSVGRKIWVGSISKTWLLLPSTNWENWSLDGTRFQPNYPHRRHLHHHDRGHYRHHHHHFFFSRRFLRANYVISILIIDGTISYSLFEFHDILNAFLLAIMCSHTPTTQIQNRLAEKYREVLQRNTNSISLRSTDSAPTEATFGQQNSARGYTSN